MDQTIQKGQYYDDLGRGSLTKAELNSYNDKGLFDRSKRYNKIAGKFGRAGYEAPEDLSEERYGGSYAYGGAYSAGGQYKEGGTYYLSDEEIQALIDAGYELE